MLCLEKNVTSLSIFPSHKIVLSAMQEVLSSGLQVCRFAGLRFAGFQVLRFAGFKVLRFAVFKVLRIAGLQVSPECWCKTFIFFHYILPVLLNSSLFNGVNFSGFQVGSTIAARQRQIKGARRNESKYVFIFHLLYQITFISPLFHGEHFFSGKQYPTVTSQQNIEFDSSTTIHLVIISLFHYLQIVCICFTLVLIAVWHQLIF